MPVTRLWLILALSACADGLLCDYTVPFNGTIRAWNPTTGAGTVPGGAMLASNKGRGATIAPDANAIVTGVWRHAALRWDKSAILFCTARPAGLWRNMRAKGHRRRF